MLNLLSVGRMLQKGWDCDFKGSNSITGPCCRLSYQGAILGETPLSGNLCYLNIRFIHPDQLTLGTVLHKEISALAEEHIAAFAKTLISWDIWHTRMGHPGGESIKCLPLTASSVIVEMAKPLRRCEACIMSKYPCKPHPPSPSPCASQMLNLIHSDLCGPFPV
jgi:hypothetical protein